MPWNVGGTPQTLLATGRIKPGELNRYPRTRGRYGNSSESGGAANRWGEAEGDWFHDLRHTFVTRKLREGHDYKRIMAVTGHKTFAVFQRYNTPPDEDVKAIVLADSPQKKVG